MTNLPERVEALSTLKRALLKIEELQTKINRMESDKREPIAVIGLGCRFPDADGPDAFWHVLREGIDTIRQVPDGRWDVDALYDPEPSTPGKMVTKEGGFLDGVGQFDAQFFGISPREAEQMDPQQRLLLEVVWEALEKAGYLPSKLAGSATGVFVGISSNDYSLLQHGDGDWTKANAYSGTGNAFSIAANRISYTFDLQGPSVAVDTACSSSLLAVHLAVQSLRRGESNLAIAGGVNLILTPALTITFSQAGMMSPDGRCKTFDASADGYGRGEGCGVVILKRLEDALEDGDQILAVVYGTAINQDGRSNGLTAPNGLSQQNVIRAALRDASLTADQIDYIEAHGTGTILGDPIEIRSIQAVMGTRPQDHPCIVGSVKTNIGHLEAAAGIAGFIKVVLALQNNFIPKHLHFKEMNPYIRDDEIPFEVPVEGQAWQADGKTRYAGVSSFGFGGTNSHVILGDIPAALQRRSETTRDTTPVSNKPERPLHILGLSARSESGLRAYLERYETLVNQLLATRHGLSGEAKLADLCHTANTSRAHHELRVALIAENLEDLKDRLGKSLDIGEGVESDPEIGFYRGNWSTIRKPKIAFLFTGQGAQYQGMCLALYNTQPTFRDAVDRCLDILHAHALDRPLGVPLFSVIFGDKTSSQGEGQDNAVSLINETAYTQIALFVIEYALAQLWLSWGVKPDYVLGHSIGEYVAACVAGVFSLEDGLMLIAARGNLMQSLPKGGIMAVIFADEEQVRQAVSPHAPHVSIAAINGPNNVVISGDEGAVSAVVDKLEQDGFVTRKLKVSHAFHSSHMDSILEPFKDIALQVEYHQPRIKLVSNLTGGLIEDGQVPDAEYWTQHVREAVQFYASMKVLEQEGAHIFIEIGPNPTLVGMGKRCIPEHDAQWLATIKRDLPEWEILLASVSKLYVSGFDFDWKKFDHDYITGSIITPSEIPTYPFQREKYWFSPASVTPSVDQLIGELKDSQEDPRIEELTDDHRLELIRRLFIDLDENNRQALLEGLLSTVPESDQVFEITSTTPEIISKESITRESILSTSPDQRQLILTTLLRIELSEVLRMPPEGIDVRRPVNYMGLDSIMAIELRNRISNRLKVEFPITNLLQDLSVEQLAQRLDGLLIASEETTPAVGEVMGDLISPDAHLGEYPLSYSQRAMWFQHQIAPNSIQNPFYVMRVRSELNVNLVQLAASVIIQWNPSLRTIFEIRDGEPVQVVKEDSDGYFKFIDGSALEDDEIQDYIQKQAASIYNLQSGPLFRMILISRSEKDHFILLSAHHIILDLWSIAIILNEFLILYRMALSTDTRIESLPTPHHYQYTDYIDWQTHFLASPEGERFWEYWRNHLAGELPVVELPTDYPRPAIQTFSGNSRSFILDDDLQRNLNVLSEKYGTTIYHILLSSFFILIYRYTGLDDIVIGSPMNGRSQPEFTDVVGYFVNPLPLRTEIKADMKFSELLSQVREIALDAIARQDYPFSLLVEKLHPVRDLSHLPIFQVMFVYQKTNPEFDDRLLQLAWDIEGLRMNVAGLDLETVRVDERTAPFDVTFMLAEAGERLGASVIYNTDLFKSETIDRMWDHYQMILRSIVANLESSISEISILTDPERRNLLFELNNTGREFSKEKCIHELFEAQVTRTPQAVALVLGDQSMTYNELNQKANLLAHHLIALGVGPETIVGIYMERSVEMIVGLLGVLKAGGAYLPIDPANPVDRIAYMIRDSETPVLLTQSSLGDTLPTIDCRLLYLDNEWESAVFKSLEFQNGMRHDPSYYQFNPVNGVNSQNLAYIIYTSGSTGKSKAVMLPHTGLINLVEAQTEAFNVSEASHVLQFASFSFDASVSEIFMALTTGARLVLANRETLLSVPDTIALLKEKEISIMTMPPSLLSIMDGTELEAMETVISAGESCLCETAKKWSVDRNFFNAYGPTECTIGPTYYLFDEDDLNESIGEGIGIRDNLTCPIGRPIKNMQIYLLDQDLQPVPFGIPGEMYIGGAGVARGYLSRPQLTAEKFIPNPYDKKGGSRIYKTGDLARYLSDGNIEFLGRTDYQVKVRGYRIELGEVESVLMRHQLVSQAVVVTAGEAASDRKLAAYVVPIKGNPIDVDQIRLFMRESLPDYMVPTAFKIMGELPLNNSGKVDRQKLPPIDADQDGREAIYVPPQTGLEREIAAVWQEILKVERVSLDDNFFDLGGHSLLMTKTHLRLQEVMERELSIVDLFSYPTIRLLAAFLNKDEKELQRVEAGYLRATKQKDAMQRQRERLQSIAKERSARHQQMDRSARSASGSRSNSRKATQENLNIMHDDDNAT